MSTVKRIKVKNRLAAVVRTPGGKTVAEAVHAAETGLESSKDECLDALDDPGGHEPTGRRHEDRAVPGRYRPALWLFQ